MRRAMLCSLTVVMLAGCRAGDSTTPLSALPGQPSFAVLDGASGGTGSNPDFFFLPPMAKDPSSNPNYQASAFNPNLQPTVSICALDATSAAAVTAGTPCKALPAYRLTSPATVSDGKYVYNWVVPKDGDLLYRVQVFVGATLLGFSDVSTDKTDLFVTVNDGRTLPIKFRIEQFALCATPGTGPCASGTINLAVGGTVTSNISGGSAGVIIPAQGVGSATTVTVRPCADLNPRVTDLPTFGPCVSVTADPALTTNAITNAATVFICAVQASIPPGMTAAQKENITVHRFDAPDRFAALPHAPACTPALADGSIKGLVRNVRRGAFASAGRELLAMLAPKMLHAAARRLDVGAGGFTLEFSDFQGALPARLSIHAGSGQFGLPGSTLAIAPAVKVTDLGGELVSGARVRFAANTAACAALAAGTGTVSNASGIVTDVPWAITSGANVRAACGRGLAGADTSGPRPSVDPFQPLSTHFGDASNGLEVKVATGSVLFTATGVLPATLPVAFGSGGYSSYGPFTPGSSPPVGWPNPTMAVSAIVGSNAPFRGVSSICAITTPSMAIQSFPENKDIFVTKDVTTPVAGSMTITVRIDNDMRIWVDGSEQTNLIPVLSGGAVVNDFWIHDGCADIGPAVLTIPVSVGAHKISIWAHDRGAVGYVDMQVVFNSP